ncbi:MAG: hypothetical protein AMXMBFR8_28750 [Nevskiales bacterium]
MDGELLRRALRAGIAQMLGQTDLLNRINVFPVPDGDTGTNMALTLGAVDQALVAAPAEGAGELLATAADAAIDAARGNSGAILAEFLQGLADAVGERRELDLAALADAFTNADRYARGALDAPQEGTIISVISAVAGRLSQASREQPGDLPTALELTLTAAGEAVAATRNTLPALRRAGVEDAGARGFLSFLEGFVAGALGRAVPEAQLPSPAMAARDEPGHIVVEATGQSIEFRFCTECIVAGPTIDRRRLHDELGTLGTSLVLAGNRRKVRIHIHTNDPGAVFAAAGRFGTVAGEKADDMRRQAQTRSHAGQAITVVTDSGADLPEELCEELGIHMIPLRIHFADRTFLDKVSLTSGDFLRELDSSPVQPRTSQPAPGDLRRVYEYLVSHHEHVVAISLDRQVSGTWQASQTAARRSSAPHRITVIDSRNASIGQGLVALHAAECARSGMPVAELLDSVRGAAAATRSFAVVADLAWAARGGRLPESLRWLTRALPVRPVLHMGQGAVGVSGVFLRGRDPVAALLARLTATLAAGERYRFAVAHAGLPDAAARLAAALHERVPGNAGVFVSELGAAASVHSGPETLVVALQPGKPPAATSQS